MPVYNYKCHFCNELFEKFLPLSLYKTMQDCPNCDSKETEKIVSKTNFVLKGDGWPGKDIKINRQMAQKNKRLDRKMAVRLKEDTSMPTLVPNVGGEEVDSWSDAKKLASDKGKVDSSYDKLIRSEKGNKK